jgi:hypothetical protein
MKTGIFTSWIGSLIIAGLLLTAYQAVSQTPQYIFSGPGSVIGNVSPFGTTGNTRKLWIFKPSNFVPAAPAGLISAIYFRTSASPTSSTYTNLLVKMGPTALNTFVTGPYPATPMDTVFFAVSHTVSIITSGPWLKITFQTPYFYDGSTNFIVDVTQGGYTSAITIQQQTVTGTCLYGPGTSTTGTVADRLVEFGFDLIPGSTDVGLEAFVGLPDTVCAGSLPVTVSMKNHGPNTMGSATINWTLNNVLQLPFTWTGTLAVNATTNVTIGTALIPQGTTSSITAWVGSPNGGIDTIKSNDTIYKPEIHAVPAPQVSLNDTLLVICQGDTTVISGTLTGSPPWNLVINDGTTNIPVNNIISPIFAIPLTPTLNKTYTITSLSDASGCAATPGVSLQVIVQIAPAATITPVGNTAACQGDSVSLMASIGLNFTYDWYKDGVAVTGATSYVLHTKTSGNYSVKVTSPFGCSNLSAPLSVVIHPLPSVFLGNDTNVVPGATVILNAGPGFNSYQWSTGAVTQSITVDTAGHGPGIQTIWVECATTITALGATPSKSTL